MIIEDELLEYHLLFFEQAKLEDNEVDIAHARARERGRGWWHSVFLSFFHFSFFFVLFRLHHHRRRRLLCKYVRDQASVIIVETRQRRARRRRGRGRERESQSPFLVIIIVARSFVRYPVCLSYVEKFTQVLSPSPSLCLFPSFACSTINRPSRRRYSNNVLSPSFCRHV